MAKNGSTRTMAALSIALGALCMNPAMNESRALPAGRRALDTLSPNPNPGLGTSGGASGLGHIQAGEYKLHVISPSNLGLRVQTDSPGGDVASFGGYGGFRIDAPGVVGGRFVVTEAGNVGIGAVSPDEKLTVAGTIRSTSGGFKFPDGSVQTSAVTSLNNDAYFTTVGDNDVHMPGGSSTSVLHLDLPAGLYFVTATVEFRNDANFFGQNNNRIFSCAFSAGLSALETAYSNSVEGAGFRTVTFHAVLNLSSDLDLRCGATTADPTNVFARKRRMTAVKINGTVAVQ
jgi:hypothetical protein